MAADPSLMYEAELSIPEYFTVNDDSLDIPSIIARLTHPVESKYTQNLKNPVVSEFVQNPSEEGIPDLLENIWTPIITTAVTSPEKHEKLFQILKGIRSKSELKIDGVTATLWDLVIWTDLPMWRFAVGDKYNYCGGKFA
jgi:hypothetical protein